MAAVLLLAVGALAAAAAHVSKSGVARGDIALVDPVPDRTAQIATPDLQPLAPLFAGQSAARTTTIDSEAGAFGSNARSSTRQFEFVSRSGFGNSSSYRNFAGERRNNGNSGGSSGSGGIGAGGMGGGGGAGGASGSRRATNAPGTRPTRAANTPRQTSGSRPGAGGGGGGAGGSVLPGNAIVAGSVVATTAGPLSNSPGTSHTPEPLTLLLVGSGLAGLYGARKHLVG